MRFLVAVFLALFWALAPAMAQPVADPVQTENALSRLVSEKAGIAPGETVRIGLYQELRDGWHVYWRNPGDSGLPLEMDWTVPEGWSVGAILYPVPHRIPLGPLVNFGHEGTPLFMMELTAPAEAEPGSTVSLSVDATWLICADICIPESGTLGMVMPVVAEPADRFSRDALIFAAGRDHLPADDGYDAVWFDVDGKPVLDLAGDFGGADEIFFFPYENSLIEPAGAQRVVETDGGVRLFMQPGFEYDTAELDTLAGVVTVENGAYRGTRVTAARAEAPADALAGSAAAAPGAAAGEGTAPPNLLAVLGLAFLGGLILNIMPCVFPVIFIKAANLAHSVQESRATVVRHGILYTVGILAAFLAIAGALLALRAGGEQVGWGFHLQDPLTVAFFAVIIFLVGLNLAGLFEIGTSVQGVGSGLASRGGDAGAFFTGLLAVAVAAPCIGPFLGAPLGFAVLSDSPAWVGLLVFGVIGLGLATPYLLISLIPGLARILPRPGAWMETFKQILSFAMFATLIWLIWVLTGQTGSYGLLVLLIALLLFGMAAWAFGRSQAASGGGRLAGRVAALVLVAGGLFVTLQVTSPPETGLEEVPYSEETLAGLRAEGRPVFVDFTADWCVTCQANKLTVLTRSQVVDLFNDKDVVFMTADWTSQDPEITRALAAQGRSGVPLYLFYAPGEEAEVLPQVLSIDLMRDTFSVL